MISSRFSKHLLPLLLFLFAYNAQSQIDCPASLNGMTSETGVFEPFSLEPWGIVDFEYRVSGNNYEIKVDWSTLQNLGKYALTDDELKPLLYKAIIVQILYYTQGCNTPGNKIFTFYEVTECTIRKKCYLKLNNDRHVFCFDDGWPGPDPEIYEYSSEKYYRYFSKFVCGYQCCQYIFTVECVPQHGGGYYAHIISRTKEPEPNSTCPESDNYDCFLDPPQLNPCQSNCNE